jgi:phage baseplate assembly protein W
MADDSGKAFLGSGLRFPLALDAAGRFRMNAYEEHVAQAIGLVLRTRPRERAMRPEFGAGLDAQLFAPLGEQSLPVIEHMVREALLRFEPRIDVLGLRARLESGLGRLAIELTYRVRNTDSVLNLVFPFYLERGLVTDGAG